VKGKLLFKRHLLPALVGCTLMAVAVVPGMAYAAPAHTQTTSTSASAPAAALTFLTDRAYTARFGAAKATANGIATPAAAPDATAAAVHPNDPVIHWYTVDFSSQDWQGRDIPTRHGKSDAQNAGSSGFGYTHACTDHDLCSFDIIDGTYQEVPESHSGTRYQYGGVLTDSNGNVKMRFVSSQDQSETTAWGNTPDGRPMGTITAYCKGYTLCPSWVNAY
jgi:hypothetical protein